MCSQSISDNVELIINLYLSGYRGTVRRVLGNTNPVWFEAQVPRDCENVPDQVNAGKPPKDICATVRIKFIIN